MAVGNLLDTFDSFARSNITLEARIVGSLDGGSKNALNNVVAITAGNAHTCAVLAEGTAKCWGALTPDKLGPYSAATGSAAASKLAASRVAARQLAPNRYAANSETASVFMATSDGREVLSFIVSCALLEGVTLVGTLPDGSPFGFFGEVGLANEWLDHPLRKAGRGWVSACLFARVNTNSVAVPFSMRGQTQALATTPEEEAAYTLEEGAFYGDYFSAPGEPVQWIACRGRDQAAGETGGLVLRDCAEPDPNDPTRTLCGFTYAGDCGAFEPASACEHFAPEGFYRKCQDRPGDESHSDVFRQVITTFVQRPL